MPTVGHLAAGVAVAGIAAATAGGDGARGVWRTAAGALALVALTLLPDLDFIAKGTGIPASAPFAHRGALHSLAAAVAVGGLAALLAPRLEIARARAGLFAFAAVASHGLLDLFSQGDQGVALLWPLSDARLLAPWRPIPAISLDSGLFTLHNVRVALTELLILVPLWLPGAVLVAARLRRAAAAAAGATSVAGQR